MRVAILGASNDRRKFGNKAVRAYLEHGFEVFPVNLSETMIEGLPAYRSVLEIPGELDRVTVYLPPEKTMLVLDDIAAKGTKELILNPGSENEAVVEKAMALGLEPRLVCSILDIGESPERYR